MMGTSLRMRRACAAVVLLAAPVATHAVERAYQPFDYPPQNPDPSPDNAAGGIAINRPGFTGAFRAIVSGSGITAGSLAYTDANSDPLYFQGNKYQTGQGRLVQDLDTSAGGPF